MTNQKSRRRFLSGSVAALLRPQTALAALAGGGLLIASPAASAFPWVVALSAASSLTGMMASNQRGDGGLSATMEANLEYMRVMSGQLTSIQTGLASLISAVNQLGEQFRQSLQAERAIELHHAVGAQIKNYRDEYERFMQGNFPTFSAWQDAPLTVANLQEIDFALNTAVSTIDQYRLYGPLTALQLPTALFCALAVRVALKERKEALAVKANQYLARFEACGDESNPSSTAAQLQTSLAGLAKATKDLQELGVTISEDGDTFRKAVLDLTVAAQCEGYEKQPPGDCMANCTTSNVVVRIFTTRADIYRDTAAGGQQAGGLIRPLALTDGTPVLKDRASTRIQDPKLFPNLPRAYVSAKKGLFGMECRADDATYQKAVEVYVANDLEKLQKIRAAINQYNMNLGQVALCASASASLLVARQALFKSFARPT